MGTSAPSAGASGPRLRRSLGLTALVFYGVGDMPRRGHLCAGGVALLTVTVIAWGLMLAGGLRVLATATRALLLYLMAITVLYVAMRPRELTEETLETLDSSRYRSAFQAGGSLTGRHGAVPQGSWYARGWMASSRAL